MSKLKVKMSADPTPVPVDEVPVPVDEVPFAEEAPAPAPAKPTGLLAQGQQLLGNIGDPGEAIDAGVDSIGSVQSSIESPISQAVNMVTGMINGATAMLGKQKMLEDDPTGAVEMMTEVFNVPGDIMRAVNANVVDFLGLDSRVPKALIKLGEEGDRNCDAAKGVKMTVEFPGWTRQYNACIDYETAKNLRKQIFKEPLKPVTNFAECSFSEVLLKPIDHAIRDIKNGIGGIVGITKAPMADPIKPFKDGINLLGDTILKGLSGTYLIQPPILGQSSWDALTCFQNKTNNVQPPYKTVNIDWFLKSITDMSFLNGDKMEPTPFSSKLERKCDRDHEDMCKI